MQSCVSGHKKPALLKSLSLKIILKKLLEEKIIDKAEKKKIEKTFQNLNIDFPCLSKKELESTKGVIIVNTSLPEEELYFLKIKHAPYDYFGQGTKEREIWTFFCHSLLSYKYKNKLEYVFNHLVSLAINKKA